MEMEIVEKNMKKVLNLPTEIEEEILLKLPVKSLLRFSSISKAWKSMISETRFVKRYRRRADRELKLFLTSESITVSSLLSSSTKFNFESVVCPFLKYPCLLAFSDELWLVYDEGDKSLFLWNPSMRTYKRLSNPTIPRYYHDYVYGMGYDSIADDYKILKLPRLSTPGAAELYCLKSDSWGDISDFSWGDISDFSTYIDEFSNLRPFGVFVSENLHWSSLDKVDIISDIISFNLSTEKFGEVAQPKYFPTPVSRRQLCVLKVMLCLSLHSYSYLGGHNTESDIWVMEEYGVATSWTKMFSFKPLLLFSGKPFQWIVPLYIYESGELLIRVTTNNLVPGIFVYIDDNTTPREVFLYSAKYRCRSLLHDFLYAESFVAPAMWSTTKSDSVRKL